MEGRHLAIILLFTLALLHQIPSAFGNYNISESLIQQFRPFERYCDLVLQWRISACMTGKPCVDGVATQSFGIHGLWPMQIRRAVVEPLVYCIDRPCFDKKNIRPLLGDLVRLWPALYDSANDADEQFWKYEWEKHGTCLAEGFEPHPKGSVFNYFDKAVSWANSYNIWEYLTSEGIIMDEDYDVSEITNAIRTGLKTELTNPVQVQCVKLNGRLVVTQIFLCLNEKATALADCPHTRTLCSGRPMFPSSTSPPPPPPPLASPPPPPPPPRASPPPPPRASPPPPPRRSPPPPPRRSPPPPPRRSPPPPPRRSPPPPPRRSPPPPPRRSPPPPPRRSPPPPPRRAPPPPRRAPPPPRRPRASPLSELTEASFSERSDRAVQYYQPAAMSSESGAPMTLAKGVNVGIESSVPLLEEI